MKPSFHQNQRMTRQKTVIYEELSRLKTHPTADELYQIVRQRIPKISLGTVYRNLEMLAACGRARKIELSGHPKRFDACMKDHHHIRCTCCGDVGDIEISEPESLQQAGKCTDEFLITGYRIEITGLCRACQKKKAEGDGSGKRVRADFAGNLAKHETSD